MFIRLPLEDSSIQTNAVFWVSLFLGYETDSLVAVCNAVGLDYFIALNIANLVTLKSQTS